MKGSLLALAALSLCLTGCMNRYAWEKPGAGQGEFEQIKALCQVEAHNQVPADQHIELISPGSTYQSNNCKGHGCTSYSTYTPPQYGPVDRNDGLREQVVRACYFRNGWQEVKIGESFLGVPTN